MTGLNAHRAEYINPYPYDKISQALQTVLKLLRRQQTNEKLFVLDSSFNPPHNAHVQMAMKSGGNVLFLLSTVNADKTLYNYEERIDYLMSLDFPVAICDCARFVEKAKLLPPCTFILGYDTLLRFFNPKYYKNMKAELDHFFKEYRLKVFDRGENSNPMFERSDLEHALKWKDFVEICEPVGNVSSTHIRSLIQAGKIYEIKNLVPASVFSILEKRHQ